MNKKIAIYYPSKITGGAEYLLKTTAELLKNDYDVTIVDIEDGWLSNNILEVNKIIIENNNKIFLDENTILITTANLIRTLDKSFLGNFKILGWNVHGFNIVPMFPKIGTIQHNKLMKILLKYTFLIPEYKYLGRLVNYLKKNNSLYIMDESCSDILYKYYNLSFDTYLPVVISNDKFTKTKKEFINLDRVINCVWLGRLDNEFKTPILNHVLFELSKCAKLLNRKIVFNIIGDGPGLENTKRLANQINDIEINFLLEKRGKELKEVLYNSDIGFAMGTSALEMGALKLPVVLLDASYGKIPNGYTYKWIFQEKNYNIGHMIETYPLSKFTNRYTMEQILNIFLKESDNLSIKSYEYVKNNHSIDVLKEKIINAINSTTSNFSEMSNNNLFKKPYWHKLKKLLRK